jgi:hypothetical protein
MALTPKETEKLDQAKRKLADAMAGLATGKVTPKESRAICREAENEMRNIEKRLRGKSKS